MFALYITLSILLFIFCAGTVVMILMQKKRDAGMSAAFSGIGQGKTFYDKNKGRTLEGKLETYTKISGAVFMLLSLLLNVIH